MRTATRFVVVLLLCAAWTLLLPAVSPARAADGPAAEGLANPFFVLSNGVQDAKHRTPELQAAMLKELGYDGIGPSGCGGIPEMARAMEAQGLTVFAQYVGANLDPDKPRYDPGLPEAIKAMKGHGTFVWLTVHSSKYKPSSSDGDPRAVEVIREIAGMAAESGLDVALYPHNGFYVERVEDAVRVAKKVDRENVGVTFNLCHWLKLDKPESMKPLMELAAPHLFLVTINGADRDGTGWGQLIQPLDRGTFAVGDFLETLKGLGYTGPVGLQCYAVPGDKHENLKRSMAAWRKISAEIAAAEK